MDSGRVLNIREFLNEQPFPGLQRIIFAPCFATVLLDNFDTAVTGHVALSPVIDRGVSRPAPAQALSAAPWH